MHLTGIAILDNLLNVVLSGALTWLLIVGVFRKVSMFQKHQYAQLLVSVLIMALLFWIIKSPDSFIAVLTKASELFNKLKE
ncbi:hypothetical protein QO009_004103 [Brevibacillus aydinogluensis]|jgi:hypothetical protein|uniref:TcpD family membrane protein n=1 Tax=Brevibacillus aydinogluensis TaxID=927786 RepID=UPI002892AF0F|nr:TcpD family membrane protein [Brevibacillus aydinogluensis]MDT3418178.1 hypothetical protein [Brevibacillus aydinogluensis]